MEIKNNISSGLSFGVNVSPALKNDLLSEAALRSSEYLKTKVIQKIGIMKNWGHEASEITTSLNINGRKKQALSLSNKMLSDSYSVLLPERRPTTLNSFLELTITDIFNAEKEISNKVNTNKTKLILKAATDEETMIKITGKAKPTDAELATAIDNLTEEEIINFRFGVDNKPGSNVDIQA